ncbi:MAG: BamA/TamA family outer membrane protein [Verrucomicrobiia bacterium]
MKRTRILVLISLMLAAGTVPPASGATILVGTNGVFVPDHFLLPYAFYSQFFGAAGAVAYGASGTPQKQMSYVASAMAGTEGSVAIFFLGKDIQMPFCDRLFLDPWLSAGYYNDQHVFIQGNPNYANQQAGSNGSDKNNYVSGDGTDLYAYLNFKYELPMGAVRDNPIPTQVVDRGMLVSGATGGKTWNPLTGGITEIQFQPFSRQQTVNSPDVTTSDIQTTGLTTGLSYDNRDFELNPSCGSYQQVSFSRDFGVPNSTATWSAVQAKYDKFFSLGATDHLRQQVLAFSFWTAQAITWQEQDTGTGPVISHRPPNFAGATLGGLFRMRAYPSGRFSDKSAIYYCAEYRVIPDGNPLNSIPYVKKLQSDWIQGVVFVETGRVAPEWSITTLHSQMKYDAGVGLRVMVKQLVGRLDLAYGEEGAGVQMMVGQSF